MEVRLFPNWRRPQVGLKPRREAQRPHLPQHARHCPVLEAGSSLGFMVYPPLEKHEVFKVWYEGEGLYRFVYYVNPTGTQWEGVLSVAVMLPAGGVGMFREEVTYLAPVPDASRENALLMARMFIVPEDLGTPAGAVTLRGAWNFQTPPGWDTVYTPVFNMIERPVVPMMVIRVETDWHVHESEFRYVLQPGQSISAAHSLPIGQAFFVPRDDVSLRDCTESEVAALKASAGEFTDRKAALKRTTSYGLQYSPHYRQMSRAQGASRVPTETGTPSIVQSSGTRVAPVAETVTDGTVGKTGRNEPCPCGSGRKYKKCHGQQP